MIFFNLENHKINYTSLSSHLYCKHGFLPIQYWNLPIALFGQITKHSSYSPIIPLIQYYETVSYACRPILTIAHTCIYPRLQKELELYRDRAEDIKCEQLTAELSQLQENYYHHQLEKKSRQHYEKQKEGRLGNAGYIAHYNPYKRNSQQEGQKAKDLVPIEDEWFENMADEDWVIDIDDEIDELIKADSSDSNNQVNVNAESTVKTANEKEPKPVTR